MQTDSSSRCGIKAILLMGGSGKRFNSETPKQFHLISGKKIYLHTLDLFLSSCLFDEIILVAPSEWISSIKQDLIAYSTQAIRIVKGGDSRQESSFQGLLSCDPQTHIVVIHDAVRPFVSVEILEENIQKANQFYAVDTCIPSTDTLVYAPNSQHIEEIPCRARYLRGQTPQTFHFPLILDAHRKAQSLGLNNQSDDCSLVIRQGHPVHIVKGSEENIKITSSLDLFLAEQIYRIKHSLLSYQPTPCSLKGKYIGVTGGNGGIGSKICELLEKEGAIPLIISRSAPIHKADLTSYQQAKQIFDNLLKRYGPLDGLINSVGYLKTDSLDCLSDQEIDKHIGANLTSVIYSCKCATLKQGAHIINIASSSYLRGKKNYTVYASTKAALINFTQGLSEEKSDLFINVLIPERTNTPLRLKNFPDEDPLTLLDPTLIAEETIALLKQHHLTGSTIPIRRKIYRRGG